MKKVIIVCIFLTGYLTYAQQGYRYGAEHINLEVENNMFFVQTKNDDSDKSFLNEINVLQQQNKLKSFSKISTNRYLVFSDERIENATDYFSDVYKSSNQNQVIVLPRIVLSLKKGKTIEFVMKKFPEILSVEKTDGVRYVLKCHINHSKDVLDIIGIMNEMEEIEWCEPEMLLDYKQNNPLYSQQFKKYGAKWWCTGNRYQC